MRLTLLGLALVGCGPVRLGEESPLVWFDAGKPGALDAQVAGTLAVSVTVTRAPSCDGCAALVAEVEGGRPPYSFLWDDGSQEARREVCNDDGQGPFTVQVRDADGLSASPHVTRLELDPVLCTDDASLPLPPPPPPPLLCLQNASFEGKAAINLGVPTNFDAMPWSVCTNPSQSNTPDIVDETIEQMVVTVPKATHGLTYLGMFEGEQTSQALCRPIPAGGAQSFLIDLSRIQLGAGVVPDSEATLLEIWGGVAGDCSQRELLWASPKLELTWKTYCVTLWPSQYMDNLTLRARSDMSLASQVYMIADHIVPVERCL